MKEVSDAALERLPIYLNYLHELKEEEMYISSAKIARELGFGEVQVRKDLALASSGGKPKVGYETKTLIEELTTFLGCNTIENAVIVGAGKLGRAILGYEGFTRYGVDIKAAFGHHANKIIDIAPSKPVLQLDQFEEFCRKNDIKIGIITVPVKYAQEICDLMVKCGIKAIWNFARKSLNVPSDVIVRQEDLGASLSILSYQLKNKNK